MARCTFLPQARADLREIGHHIARDNRQRAISYVEELQQACQRLADTPGMGRARDELRPGLRSFAHGSYVILNRRTAGGIEVVIVLHGARDIGRLV